MLTVGISMQLQGGPLHGPKYGTIQLSTTHKVRSLTNPTEGVANSYSRLNRPIKYVPVTVLNPFPAGNKYICMFSLSVDASTSHDQRVLTHFLFSQPPAAGHPASCCRGNKGFTHARETCTIIC